MGMEIGSHSKTHRFPANLSLEELYVELVESKMKLEDILGKEVKFFSNPSGYLHPKLSSLALKAGYQAVCLGKIGSVYHNSNPLGLPRIAIKRSYSQTTFQQIVQFKTATILRYSFSESCRHLTRILLGEKIYETIKKILLAMKIKRVK